MKNIVICCDGTGNEYGPNNTNVVKLYFNLSFMIRNRLPFMTPVSEPLAIWVEN